MGHHVRDWAELADVNVLGLKSAAGSVLTLDTAGPRPEAWSAWTPAELDLLCAIVFEFGPNWLM